MASNPVLAPPPVRQPTRGQPLTGSPVKKARLEVDSGPSAPIRYAITALIVAILVTDRFAVAVGSLPLGAPLPLVYVLLAILLLNGRLAIQPISVLFYVGGACVGVMSYVLNANVRGGNATTLSSLLLLLVIYFPLTLVLSSQPDNRASWRWMMRTVSNVLVFVAIAGIVQFYAQFVIREAWLFNASLLIPDPIRGKGIFNSAISVGPFFKSNGFFSREPSGFSYLMAFGLLIELALFKRVTRMLCFALGLVLSYSGTGLLMLAVGLLLPVRPRLLIWLALAATLLLVGNTLADDPLKLAYTFGRLGEFSAPGSSAYERYVAPMHLVDAFLEAKPWSMWVGNGPGMTLKAGGAFGSHDPTWAKLLFEYGLLGFVLFVGFTIYKLSVFPVPFQFRAVLFASWLVTGGQLLSPENVYFAYVVLGLWPREAPA